MISIGSPNGAKRLSKSVVPGTTVLLKRFAPLGDPMEIIVRGYSLSIRKEDAKQILVERLS